MDNSNSIIYKKLNHIQHIGKTPLSTGPIPEYRSPPWFLPQLCFGEVFSHIFMKDDIPFFFPSISTFDRDGRQDFERSLPSIQQVQQVKLRTSERFILAVVLVVVLIVAVELL